MENEIHIPERVRQPHKVREYAQALPVNVVDGNGNLVPVDISPQVYLNDSTGRQYTNTLRIKPRESSDWRFDLPPDMEQVGVSRVGASDDFLRFRHITYLLLDPAGYLLPAV